MKVIELRNITKIVKSKRLLKHVSLTVDKGVIYGLIGSDHSRKSLLIKLMLGIGDVTEGEVLMFGQKFHHKLLHKIGVAVDDISFYEDLTGKENILYYLEQYKKRLLQKGINIDRHMEYYFKTFDLYSNMNLTVKNYSLGMLQKLRLIRAFIIEPEILILDEPAKSMDPVAIKILKNQLQKKCEEGVTIFIATSMLSFISDLADHIGVLHYGEIIDEISEDQRQKNQQAYLEIHSSELPKLILIIERELSLFDYEVMDDHIIRILGGVENDQIIKTLIHHGIEINQAKNGFISLEDFFLTKIGE